MDFNKILVTYIGEIGRYQIRVLLLLLTVRSPSVIHNMGYIFYAATPPHWCTFERHSTLLNLTVEEWKMFSIPSEIHSGERVFSECTVYEWTTWPNLTSYHVTRLISEIRNGTIYGSEHQSGCRRWEYDATKHVRDSLVTQFDLVCGRAWMKSMVATVFILGWLVSSPLTGFISDKFGRRKVMTGVVVGYVAFGMALPFINSYPAFLVTRFLLSACINAALVISYTASMELVGPRYRTSASCVFLLVWAFGYAIIAGVAYFLRDRLSFMIAIAAPTSLILITVWFIPESVQWLVAKGHQAEADHLIRRMAKINRKSLPEHIRVTVEKTEEKSRTNYLDLVKTPNMRRITFIICIDWFAMDMLYYAIAWTATDISNNLYLNVFLSGIIEVPAYFIMVPVTNRLGRRIPMAGTVFFSGLAMLVSLTVQEKGAGMLTLMLLAKFFATIALSILFQYTSEVYPTVLRTTGFSTSQVIALIGNMLAPFLPLLGVRMPSMVCGSLALIVSLPTLLLPETLNRNLPSNVQEVEEFGKPPKIRDLLKLPRKNYQESDVNSEEKVALDRSNLMKITT